VIVLAFISIGALSALALGVLVFSALTRDLVRAHRRRVAQRAQADLDARVALFHRDFTEWCAREVDEVWSTERRAA
jgi:hypothetical protein